MHEGDRLFFNFQITVLPKYGLSRRVEDGITTYLEIKQQTKIRSKKEQLDEVKNTCLLSKPQKS